MEQPTIQLAPRGVRNSIPEVPYTYQQRRYPHAARALQAAEAIHGQPTDPEPPRRGRPPLPRCIGCGVIVTRCSCQGGA